MTLPAPETAEDRIEKLETALFVVLEWIENAKQQERGRGVIAEAMPNNVPGTRVLRDLAGGVSEEFDSWYRSRHSVAL